MIPTTQFLMQLRRYPTELHGQAKTRRILAKLMPPVPPAPAPRPAAPPA